MIGIAIANSVGIRRSSGSVVVVPIATAATGVGQTSFTANWNAFAGANYYLLDVSLNSSFSSFVGSYQNYVVIGTSQLVSGLTPNTTYYYRLRAATGVDSDAASFFTRVYTAGGTLSYSEVTATETLVYDMKTAGVWTAMKAVYPMIGGSAASCAQNLKSSSFTGTFSSGWTFASNGATPNGTSAFMNSGLNASTNLSPTSLSFGGYTSTTTDATGYSGATPPNYLMQSWKSYNYTEYWRTTVSSISIAGGSVGMIQCNQVGTDSRIYRNSTLGTNDINAMVSLPNFNMYIGATNNSGSPTFYDLHLVSYYYYADGLTPTQALNHYTAVQTFNQTLNRSVGPQIVSDADAQAYINRVYTAGGTLTNTEASAVNQLVIDMKTAGIWTAMRAVYPMVGASAAACAQNLKSSSFTGAFSSGWTFTSNGVQGNGTSTYFDTTLNPTGTLSTTSAHMSFYSRTNINESKYDMASNNYSVIVYGNTFYVNLTGSGIFTASYSVANTLGFYLGARTNDTNVNGYRNGTKVIDNAPLISQIGTQTTLLGARTTSGGDVSAKQYAFASIGDGLTDTQAASLYTAAQAFNTTLSRQV